MKKLSLLLGTLGGAMAGYLLSNKQLRDALSNADDAESAARLLGKHLQKDGKKLARQVQDFVASDEVQKHIRKAKGYAIDTFDSAVGELQQAAKQSEKQVRKAAKKGAKRATKAVKSTVKRTAKRVRKSFKTRTV